jgi:Rho GTPase-activating protein 1
MGWQDWFPLERCSPLPISITILILIATILPVLNRAALARTMRATFASKLRSSSLSAVPPPQASSDYDQDLARIARRILYRSPLPSREGYPIFLLNAAAFPDTHDVDYDALLPYVLARLPQEDELLNGTEYEVVFFAGGGDGTATRKSSRPSWAWFIQAYNVLSRAMRKRIQRLYIVHEKSWVRVLVEMFSTIVSPKFRKKVVHSKIVPTWPAMAWT